MIAIRALDGTEVAVNENAVTLVAGPYPHDLGPHTYVHGVDRGVLVTAEDAAALVAAFFEPTNKRIEVGASRSRAILLQCQRGSNIGRQHAALLHERP